MSPKLKVVASWLVRIITALLGKLKPSATEPLICVSLTILPLALLELGEPTIRCSALVATVPLGSSVKENSSAS